MFEGSCSATGIQSLMSHRPQSIQSHHRYGVKVFCETILRSERSRF